MRLTLSDSCHRHLSLDVLLMGSMDGRIYLDYQGRTMEYGYLLGRNDMFCINI